MKIAFLGPKGTYTHQAVKQEFGEENEDTIIVPYKSISECFEALSSGRVDYSVVPFENSTNGQVVFTYDLLRDWYIPLQKSDETRKVSFKIISEQFVGIHHYFLSKGKSLEKITKIYSHPQVWGQVQEFLRSKFPNGVVKIDTDSTARAAEIVSQDETGTVACISSIMSSVIYNLPIMFSKVESISTNCTRFLVLGNEKRKKPLDSNEGKQEHITSLLFTLPGDDSGALVKALDVFYKYDISMSSINSRPSSTGQWKYVFFIELIASTEQEKVIDCLKDFEKYCSEFVVMGSFVRSTQK